MCPYGECGKGCPYCNIGPLFISIGILGIGYLLASFISLANQSH